MKKLVIFSNRMEITLSILLATAVLVIASTEVDKTGASYYGEQTLHYIATNGESAVVQLRKLLLGIFHCIRALSSGNCCFTSFSLMSDGVFLSV